VTKTRSIIDSSTYCHIIQVVQEGRHVIVAGDMNDYDGRVKDSFGHVPTSMALQLMAEPSSNVAHRLISAGEHVKSADRFTDWCACGRFITQTCPYMDVSLT
jgi:hypothetical protein